MLYFSLFPYLCYTRSAIPERSFHNRRDMKIFPTADIREIDRYTIEHEPIASIDLMERASAAIARRIESHWDKKRRICIFAGPGNNGGDALAIARILSEKGYAVHTYLFHDGKLSPDCETNRRRVLQIPDAVFTEIRPGQAMPCIEPSDRIIDGLFGSGLHSSLHGFYAEAVQCINRSGAEVIAIDIPSGLFGEDNSGNDPESIVRADFTYTLQFPKLAFLFPENAPYTGIWESLDIGLHPDALANPATPYRFTEPHEIHELLHRRSKFADKRDCGHLLLVSGHYGMIGASVLSARAALRAGVGLVSVHAPQCAYPILQSAIPEAIFSPDTNECHISAVPLPDRRHTAIAIGPGIGTDTPTREALQQLLPQIGCPCLLDADALNLLAQSPQMWENLPHGTILTPHVREFDRLFGKSRNTYERIQKAREQAQARQIVILLKGAYTAIALPDGTVRFNSTGNPGMATAGCGDVLTGIIGALLAQGYDSTAAATVGVYLHGLAGDLAASAGSEESVIASDVTDHLGKAFRQIQQFG